MNISRRFIFALPLSLLAVLVAVLALWAWGPPGASGGGGVGESVMFRGVVEITQRDGAGNILFHNIEYNIITDDFKEAASDRLSTTANIGATEIYDAIQLCENTGDPCSDGDLVNNLGTALNTDQDNNPAKGEVADSTVGVYTVTETFFCNTGTGAACEAIAELQLTAGSHTGDTADTDVGALQAITVTLNDDDSLQVTWTITISQ